MKGIELKNLPRIILTLALVVGTLGLMAAPRTVVAGDDKIGYLWKAEWDFEEDFSGVLTIEVGSWQDGELVKVKETSRTKIGCTPVGSVHLNAGDAVFTGGYLQCSMDLAGTVQKNHGLVVGEIDSYGSIEAYAEVNGAANTMMPLFSHPDAVYALDFTEVSAVTSSQELWHGAGVLSAFFPGVTINTWQSVTYLYGCAAAGGSCDAAFSVGPQKVTIVPVVGGDRVQFSTGPTDFDIGRHGGALFEGRIESLVVDPGNSMK